MQLVFQGWVCFSSVSWYQTETVAADRRCHRERERARERGEAEEGGGGGREIR